MIRIITVEREFGSGGNVIAAALAERLGWTLWDQSLTDEIARRMNCDRRTVAEREEQLEPAYYRLLRAFMRGTLNLNTPRMKLLDTQSVRELAQAIQLEAAEAGNCVIVGRGSAYYLAHRRDAFHVFVYAPFSSRVRRLRSIATSEREATELAERVDQHRTAFIKRHFDVGWPTIHRFHLMINSSIGEEVATETILDTVTRCREQWK